jgi:hypothetical protein
MAKKCRPESRRKNFRPQESGLDSLANRPSTGLLAEVFPLFVCYCNGTAGVAGVSLLIDDDGCAKGGTWDATPKS